MIDYDTDFVVGANGVRLKRFEHVVASLLRDVKPCYVTLPHVDGSSPGWPFDQLPRHARVHGSLDGQLEDENRAKSKEDQLRSMLRALWAVLPEEGSFTIVDFGGGSGHLAIPLALLKPHCRILVVDLAERPLQLLHLKARACVDPEGTNLPYANTIDLQPNQLQSTAISNLLTFYGPIESFEESFDFAVALHLCGQATDLVLRRAFRGLVACPCCVGKLSTKKANPDLFKATGQWASTVEYPQSAVFRERLQSKDWNGLAQAADFSSSTAPLSRKAAKALLETDRKLYLEERGFHTALCRLEPWDASPKNDVLVAWKEGPGIRTAVDSIVEAELLQTRVYLSGHGTEPKRAKQDVASEWTPQEEQSIRDTLQSFLKSSETTYVFPVGMGGRQRKLIHYVAEQMGLKHWGHGKKNADKTVVVGRYTDSGN